jgi:tetratricopeptide (TPR) repeat protein
VAQSEQESLPDRLARFPIERYPVQHATTQFHLGSSLLHAGQIAPALDALAVARRVFDDVGMGLEAAKATVMLGVGLRSAGRLDEAASAFRDAGQELAGLDSPVEQGAAAYNLGLVLQDRGDGAGACAAWRRARELFLAAGYPAQAAAAGRDHGAALLTAGNVAAALPLLQEAAALAERAGDDPGTAAAVNALGLAHLAAHDAPSAAAVLRRALAFAPRTVRPAEHAMVKANLALAQEQAGDAARARLAARQALAVSSAAAPVRAQAQQVLSRLPGDAADDLLAVLDSEPPDEWIGVLREELLRAAELPGDERCVLVRGFLDGVLARPERAHPLAQSLLSVVLELPSRPYDVLVTAIVEASRQRAQEDVDRLQAVVGSAMARFAIPQWQRLAASLNAAATAAGRPATWR